MKPILQAILVADHVYSDEVTKKKIVVGIFDRIYFSRVEPPKDEDAPEVSGEPDAQGATMVISQAGHRMGSPFCYINLADVHGDQTFELRYVDLSTDTVLFKTNFGIRSTDPLTTAEVAFPLPPLPTGKAGTFALELLWNDEPLGSHRIRVEEVPKENKSDGD